MSWGFLEAGSRPARARCSRRRVSPGLRIGTAAPVEASRRRPRLIRWLQPRDKEETEASRRAAAGAHDAEPVGAAPPHPPPPPPPSLSLLAPCFAASLATHRPPLLPLFSYLPPSPLPLLRRSASTSLPDAPRPRAGAPLQPSPLSTATAAARRLPTPLLRYPSRRLPPALTRNPARAPAAHTGPALAPAGPVLWPTRARWRGLAEAPPCTRPRPISGGAGRAGQPGGAGSCEREREVAGRLWPVQRTPGAEDAGGPPAGQAEPLREAAGPRHTVPRHATVCAMLRFAAYRGSHHAMARAVLLGQNAPRALQRAPRRFSRSAP